MENKVLLLILSAIGFGWSDTATAQTTAGEPYTFNEQVRRELSRVVPVF